ncbi:MAG: bifunctional 3-deoxy-7-phosphoheptulonate synthase/chorismate mutase type II [Muribaculaceae bacterium]|nr:bifunctional 3-deoxy-7-phosphoheptulonate synthase/chorismate mutase type II [Muribaculaceae bacterium]
MKDNLLENISPLPFSSNGSTQLLIAGPCSAESLEQTLVTAKQLKAIGISVFRAGLWKPRTLPGTFEGVGNKGLEWLRLVKQETGMLVATEVATREHVNAVIEAGIDVLWIGARTCTNPFAVQEIADALNGHDEIAVLVKNPVNPDLNLWIGAMQRIVNAGVTMIGAILRGFSYYGNNFYRNVPEWQFAIELHRRYPHLPILCDPSHMGGKRELIAPLSQQAFDMGFDGLFIESHFMPDKALSDKEQQISPQELYSVIKSLVMREKNQSSESLEMLRQQIDECDNELLNILSKRIEVCRLIGAYKKENGMQVVQTNRYDMILQKCLNQADKLGLSAEFIKTIMSAIHQESVRQQIKILNDHSKNGSSCTK